MNHPTEPLLEAWPETALNTIRGGMFGPFVNVPLTPPGSQPPKPPVSPVTITARSVVGALAEGAVQGYKMAAATGVPPHYRAPAAAGGR